MTPHGVVEAPESSMPLGSGTAGDEKPLVLSLSKDGGRRSWFDKLTMSG